MVRPFVTTGRKPEVLIRLVVGALAVAVLLGGVWLISNIALTFDTLRSVYCRRLRRRAALFLSPRRNGGVVAPAPPGLEAKSYRGKSRAVLPLPDEIVAKRARELSTKWETEGRRAQAPSDRRLRHSATSSAAAIAPPPAIPPVRATLTVTGPAYAGKTALIAQLVAATRAQPSETSDVVRLVDAGASDGDERHVAALVETAAAADGVLFVVDQDLRAPEVAAVRRLAAKGRPLYLVLNKADQFNAADRDAVLVSIRKKMPAGFPPANVVPAAVAPSPVNREVEDARGAVRIETRRPSADVDALTKLLARDVRLTVGHTLQFATGS